MFSSYYSCFLLRRALRQLGQPLDKNEHWNLDLVTRGGAYGEFSTRKVQI